MTSDLNDSTRTSAEDERGAWPARLKTASWVLFCISLAGVALIVETVPFMGRENMFAAGGRPALRVLALGLPLAVSAVLWALGLANGTVKLRTTPLLWPLAAMAGLATVSTVFAIDRRVALFGYWLDEQGLVVWLLYFLLAFLGSQLITSRRRLLQLTTCLVGSATVVALFALLEVAGLRPFPIYDPSYMWMYQRGMSTMMNPDFLGTFLVLPAVLSVALAASSTGWQRWLAVGASVIVWLSLVYSLTRGALIGAAIGLVVLLAVHWAFRRKSAAVPGDSGRAESLRRSLVSLGIAVVAFVIAVVGLGVETIRERAAETFTQIGSSSFDLSGRLPIWSEVLRAIGKRPLFGSGPDNILFAWQPFADTDTLPLLGANALLDSAHNVYLDLSVQFGVPFMLIVVVTLGWLLVRTVRKTARGVASGATIGWMELGWAAALVGVGTAFITGITVVPILAYAFAGMGVLLAFDVRESVVPQKRTATGIAAGIAIVSALLGLVGLLAGISAVVGNQNAATPALRAQRNLAALRVAPWRQFAAYDLLASLEMLTPEEQQAFGMTIAEAHQRVTAIDGHNALRLYDAGDYYYLVERDPVKALEYAEKSLALRPRYVGALMLKGDALYATSRAAEAADYFDRAVGIEAQSGEARRWEAPWISYINFLADRSTNDGESGIKAMELLEEFRQRFPGSEQLPALEKAVQGS